MAKVNYGYIGNKEVCCGDIALSAGENEAYDMLSKKNLDTFRELAVKNILTVSPHCLNSFKNRYEFNEEEKPEATHLVQLFAKLIEDKVLQPQGEVKAKVTYHDPCYLGRHNDIYDEPRFIINSIPGIEFVEMNNIRENSFSFTA